MKGLAKKVNLLRPLDVDKITIERDHYFQDAYIIDFPLDSTPDHVWQDIFEHQWRSSRYLWDRKLFVIGDKLRLLSTANDFVSKLNWIKQVLEQTNKGIDDYNRQVRMTPVEKEAKKKRLEDETAIEDLRKMIVSNQGTL
ncbi:MAG TPA: hypothetical protein VMS94_00020 [Acidobacteriota bacterium]|jgi:hypothetical protein|nr:hypothetical protein [Acidobacteriota bacterium]